MGNVNVTPKVDENPEKHLNQLDREQQIPSRVSRNVPNAVTLAAMESSEKGEDLYGPFEDSTDLMKALND